MLLTKKIKTKNFRGYFGIYVTYFLASFLKTIIIKKMKIKNDLFQGNQRICIINLKVKLSVNYILDTIEIVLI